MPHPRTGLATNTAIIATTTSLLQAIDSRNAFRHTPLHVAVSSRQRAAVRELLGFGANPCLKFDGFSAAEVALDEDDHVTFRMLQRAVRERQESGAPMEAMSDEEEEEGEEEEEVRERRVGRGTRHAIVASSTEESEEEEVVEGVVSR